MDTTFSTIWYRPRKIFRYLELSLVLQYTVLAIVILGHFFVKFGLSLVNPEIVNFSSFQGFFEIAKTLLKIVYRILFVVFTLTSILWVTATFLKGKGSFSQSLTAVIWASIWTIPFSFLFLLTQFFSKHSEYGKMGTFLETSAIIGLHDLLIYGIIVLILTIAEAHCFKLWRAGFTVGISLSSVYFLANFLFRFI